MRGATALLLLWLVAPACNDLGEFRHGWQGQRIGDAPALKVGVADTATARLAIDAVDVHGLRGSLAIDGLVADAPIVSSEGAEADVLASLSFGGSPLRVYLAFAPTIDGNGDVVAIIALYDNKRIELRALRGGAAPVYAIFALGQR